MTEEDVTVPASAIVPFIDMQLVNPASKYHSLEFVSINNIPEDGFFFEPKLLRSELMIGRYFLEKQ